MQCQTISVNIEAKMWKVPATKYENKKKMFRLPYGSPYFIIIFFPYLACVTFSRFSMFVPDQISCLVVFHWNYCLITAAPGYFVAWTGDAHTRALHTSPFLTAYWHEYYTSMFSLWSTTRVPFTWVLRLLSISFRLLHQKVNDNIHVYCYTKWLVDCICHS